MGTDPESFSGGTHCRWSSRTFIDATFVMAKGGGAEIGATKRGKGMKIMACANKLKRPLDLDTSLFQNGDGDGDVKDTTAIARFLILLRLFFRPAKSERFCNPFFQRREDSHRQGLALRILFVILRPRLSVSDMREVDESRFNGAFVIPRILSLSVMFAVFDRFNEIRFRPALRFS